MATVLPHWPEKSAPVQAAAAASGVVAGAPHILLRVEGACAFIAALILYRMTGGGWGLFALLFLVPDLSMLGYLRGPRFGAAIYNVGHSMVGAVTLAGLGWIGGMPILIGLALIWGAHIGFDRMMGYGLKYPDAFRHTHLGGGMDAAAR